MMENTLAQRFHYAFKSEKKSIFHNELERIVHLSLQEENCTNSYINASPRLISQCF